MTASAAVVGSRWWEVTAPTLTPKGAQFVVFAKAAYLECGSIALMSQCAVARNDLPSGFVRYLTAAEAWHAGLPVTDALEEPNG